MSIKILVVDDEPAIVTAVEFLMIRAGYEVQTAYDGPQALSIAREFRPDLVLLDVMMPGMTGFEVAATLRTLPEMMDTRIIFLTAKGTDRDKQTGYAKGADYYLVKPFDNDVLVSTVHETLTYG